MRKVVLLLAAAALMTTTAYAAMPVGSMALGWVNSNAPIGIRYQVAEKIAADVGLGVASYDTNRMEFNVHLGLPIELMANDRCSLDFRPAVSVYYTSYDEDGPFGQVDNSPIDFVVHGWLTVNLMVTDNFGVNASHGLNIEITGDRENEAGDVIMEGTTDFYTVGAGVTEIGWFYWF
ncbi:MAG: hypothetical protein JW958_03740 [Candidatus Eisenbacteria bacterium]|nr:hypothetical protein [Candidatus Eisenbacteria bacterium]